MRHYIVAVESYAGDTTSREQLSWNNSQNAETAPVLFAVLRIDSEGASVVDDGYRSRQEALRAWPDAV